MGSTTADGSTNGQLERSGTAPWERGDDRGTSADDARQAKSTKSGKRSGNGSSSDRSKVWMLLDRSGSMSGREAAVVKGVGRFIAEQAAEPGTCRLTVAQFDSEAPFEVLVDDVSVHKADPHALERYEPRGLTPLFDAVARLIGGADQRISQRAKAGKKPEDQTLVIVTDGLENASTDYSAADIHNLITKRREQGWAFVYMGANQDSYSESARLGFDARSVQNYEASDEGIDEAFASVSRAQRDRRTMSSVGLAASQDDYFGGVREAEEGMRRRGRGD
ncbi:vWA domain-containing protein [Candidatus Poriferisodalis sp.]|uniref:vWA domain-containing protein n=1 Tax=Candidatus Poriferisodalis sp. TaxID=3101277 RepID=UPI003B516412